MRRARLAELTAALALATSACSLLTSLDGLSNGPAIEPNPADARADGPSGADGSPEAAGDGSTTLDVRDAGDDAGPNLEPQGTFEMGTCDPWGGFQGTVGFASLGHTGTGACRACTAPTTTDYFTADDNGAPGPVVVGASYTAEGWVRADPSSPAPSGVMFYLRNFTHQNGAFVTLEQQASPSAAIDQTWQRLEASLDVTKPGTLNVFIGGATAPGACFLFDDVVIRRVK